MNIASLGPDSRLKNPALGAGSLLDVGIYSLTWGLLTLDSKVGDEAELPKIVASQTLSHGIDVASNIILHYPSTGRQGVLTSTTEFKTDRDFARIEGTEGHIILNGIAASVPSSFTIHPKVASSVNGDVAGVNGAKAPPKTQTFSFDEIRPADGKGFFWEADAVALDIAAGRLENSTMPHSETLRVMKILDEVRRQGGARFPQDDGE